MTRWTKADLQRLDRRYAEEGIPPHQRSFRAAFDLLGPNLAIGFGGNDEVEAIEKAYAALFPEANHSWPGMGVGLAASVDRVQKSVAPVVLGQTALTAWGGLGFASQATWWAWCREDRDIAAGSAFALADVMDFTYGLDELNSPNADAKQLWHMAASNLGDVASILPTAFGVDSIIQPICLVTELSLRAALVANGSDPKSFKGPKGHDLAGLAERMASELPHRDDARIKLVIEKLPHYAGSRYEPAGLMRLEVVRLAIGAQFIAASTVRRHSERDLAAEMEADEWPGPRQAPFP